MRKINRGFTLVELLIVLMIIGILAGMLYLLIGPSDDLAKKKACSANRATILLTLENYRYTKGLGKDYLLQTFIDHNYENTMSSGNEKCPSKGVYSARSDDNGREVVFCSIHSVPSGGGGLPAGSFYIPGTGDSIVGSDVWAIPGRITITDPGKTWAQTYVHIAKDEKFLYNNAYYVAVKDGVFNPHGDYPNISPDDIPASSGIYGSGEGLVKFTGVSKKWDDVKNGDKFYRGDIVFYDGAYYVCQVQGVTGVFTVLKNANNNNHPESVAGKYAWYKLSN